MQIFLTFVNINIIISGKSWKSEKSMQENKFLWTAKVGDKGQIVIPKEARDVFDIKSGDTLLLLGDKERGIAIAKYDDYVKFANEIFKLKQGE